MRFDLDGLDVFFPYDYMYKEQYEYMLQLKKAIDDKGHVVLEMPTGTGKTVCLISLITSYQYQYPQTGKLIYCTRTVPEMYKCMEEIKRVIAYRTKLLGEEGGKVFAICLSSRRNMCVHPKVTEEGDRETVDTLCRNMTASWIRNKVLGSAAAKKGQGTVNHEDGCIEYDDVDVGVNRKTYRLCEYFETYNREGSHADIPRGVYSLDDLKSFGLKKKWCPYFMTRQLIHHANILVYNYQYMLDPKVSNIISRELEAESIVVFDEAHNIDNVCIEALSVIVDKKMIDSSLKSVNRLQHKVVDMKTSDTDKLRKEYDDLVRGLTEQYQQQQLNNTAVATVATASTATAAAATEPTLTPAPTQLTPITDDWIAPPILTNDILQEAIPGNIRKAEHFIAYLKKIIVHLKSYFEQANVEHVTPLSFLHNLQQATGLERKPLKFTYTRLNSLLRTLEITSLEEYQALGEIANFMTLVATYLEGFAVVIEPQGSIVSGVIEPLVQLCCLDASIAIKPVFERFHSVIITSGTLSPLDLYPKLLNFTPLAKVSLPMSTFRPCLLPLIITRGNDQMMISTRYELRNDLGVIRNYGMLLIDVVSTVPDGICCFFTSYQYMEYVISEWDKMHILKEIMQHKLIYLETKDVVETTLALENYRRACDCGRGAIFFSIARGKVAEGIDFDRHYGRCVLLFGIPYQYTLSQTLKARLNYLREQYNIRDNDFLTFDALRQASQCIGRVIRSKTDYGIVILADARYARPDKRNKFPPWITQFIRDASINLSTDLAIDQIRSFLKEVGQPIEQDSLRSILWNEEQVKAVPQQYYAALQQQPSVVLPVPVAAEEPIVLDGDEDEDEDEIPPPPASPYPDNSMHRLGVEEQDDEMREIEAEFTRWEEIGNNKSNGNGNGNAMEVEDDEELLPPPPPSDDEEEDGPPPPPPDDDEDEGSPLPPPPASPPTRKPIDFSLKTTFPKSLFFFDDL